MEISTKDEPDFVMWLLGAAWIAKEACCRSTADSGTLSSDIRLLLARKECAGCSAGIPAVFELFGLLLFVGDLAYNDGTLIATLSRLFAKLEVAHPTLLFTACEFLLAYCF